MATDQKNGPRTKSYASPGIATYKPSEDLRRQAATLRGIEPDTDKKWKRTINVPKDEQIIRTAFGDYYSVFEAGSSETGKLTQEEKGTLYRIHEHCRDYLCRKWNVSAGDLVFHAPATPTEERKLLEELLFERLHPALEPQVGAYLNFLSTIITRVERRHEKLLQIVLPYFSIGAQVEISPEELEKLISREFPSEPFMDYSTAKHVLEQFYLTAKPEDFWIAPALGETLCSQFAPGNARQVQESLQTNSEDFLSIRELLYTLYKSRIIPARTLITLAAYARVRGISEATFSELSSTYQDEEPILFCGSEEEQKIYRNNIGDFFRVILTDGSQFRNCLSYSSFVVVASEAFLTTLSAYSQHLKESDEKQRQFIIGVDINELGYVTNMIRVGLENLSRLREKRDRYRDSLTGIGK